MKDYGKGGRPGKTGKVIPKAIPTTRVTRSAAHNNTTAEPPQPPEPEMNIPRPVTPSRDSVDGEESDDDVIVAGRTTPTPTPTVMTTPTRKRTYQDTVLTMSTPTRKRNATIGDRGMPIRNEGNSLIYNMEVTPLRSAIKRKHDASLDEAETNARIHTAALQSETMGLSSQLASHLASPTRSSPQRMLQFTTPRKATKPENISADERFSSAPLSAATKAILNTPTKPPRVISRAPYKVLDAPELQDDFYLNLVDWSSKNMLGVGLGACVYLWNAGNSKVDKLCDLSQFEHVTSVSFNPSGSHVAIGTSRGHIELWDVVHSKRVRQLTGHTCRVGSLAWNGEQLTSGSRDKNIMHRDLRVANSVVRTLSAHKQEVCGLKWNYQGTHLASGGNDNKLMIWDRALQPAPIHVFSDHVAAVKAIAWSPYKPHVLASGGGTADRRIRFWNVTNGTCLASIDTHSQVCNLAWSRNSNEIVSTHGYSQNQVCVWSVSSDDNKYTLKPLATLTGHTFRVLYLAMSPDGQSIVTGAGDETLRFWNVFPKMKQKEDFYTSLLSSPFHDNLPTNKTMR